MNQYDKIFLVNLKTRNDRLTFMKYKLKNANINNFELVEAVNGYSDDMIKLYDQYRGRKYYGTISSPGAIGLLHTWKNLMKECIEKNYNRVLILEDDIYFHKNYNKILEDHVRLFDTYNVVLLGGNQERWDPVQIEQIKKNTFYEYSKDKWCCTYGTYGISLDQTAIRVIYNSIKDGLHEETPTIDVQINILIRSGKLSGVVMHPYAIIPETRDSDNMKEREMDEISKSRKWILTDYNCIDIYENIINYRKNNINPRQNKNIRIADISRETLLSIYDGKQLPFVFIIPSYCNSKWVENNLKSVFDQNYYNWRAIYIDDASDDDTFDKAVKLAKPVGMENRFIFMKNVERKYQAYNRYIAYSECNDEEICVMLDGDDWLAHNNVLHVLNEEYQKHNLLVSYGQFSYFENGRIGITSGKYTFPPEVIKNGSYRQYQWISQHLRTCSASIIKNIPIVHLKDQYGKWLTRCTDMAEMFYALENSGGRHKNIGSALYIYNKDNSLHYPNSYYNEDSIQRDELIKYIRNHPIVINLQNKEISKMIIMPKEKLNHKYCYQPEFTQTETFVVPLNGVTDYNLFIIKVRVVDDNNYTFRTKITQKFEVLKAVKTDDGLYMIYVKNKKKIKKIKKYTFNIVAKCENDIFISQPFYVFSYGNVYTEKISKIVIIDPLFREHGQVVSIIKGHKWELQNDYMLVKTIPNHIIAKPHVYHIQIQFNEKILDIIVDLVRL